MKTEKKMGFDMLKLIFQRPPGAHGDCLKNDVKVMEKDEFPWLKSKINSSGVVYNDVHGQAWRKRDDFYMWSPMGGLSKLSPSGSDVQVEVVICLALSARFTGSVGHFTFTWPSHLIHSAYVGRLVNGYMVERSYETSIYWVTPGQIDSLRKNCLCPWGWEKSEVK